MSVTAARLLRPLGWLIVSSPFSVFARPILLAALVRGSPSVSTHPSPFTAVPSRGVKQHFPGPKGERASAPGYTPQPHMPSSDPASSSPVAAPYLQQPLLNLPTQCPRATTCSSGRWPHSEKLSSQTACLARPPSLAGDPEGVGRLLLLRSLVST